MTTEQKTRKPVMTVAIIALQICVVMTALAFAQGQGQTTRVSVDSAGIQGNGGNNSPSISANGRFVAFESYASDLVTGDTNGMSDVFVNGVLSVFEDVSLWYWAYDFIMAVYNRGMTRGCLPSPLRFCPDSVVTRSQMAVFIEAALGHASSLCAGQFSDMPVGHPFCRFIEHLAGDGITSGCGGGNYCPDAPVTRAQMAVFLAAAPPVTP